MASTTEMIKCIHCRHGRFMQWMSNPVICECDVTHERQVAEASRLCPSFEDSHIKNPAIAHYDKY